VTGALLSKEGVVLKLGELAVITCALSFVLMASAQAQELSIPCYAFVQDPLGNWIATEPVTMDLPDGTIDVAPGHRVSIPVAEVLDARCW
jgi:hypothetical protein